MASAPAGRSDRRVQHYVALKGDIMFKTGISRRSFIGTAGAAAASSAVAGPKFATARSQGIKLPPAISREERLQRLSMARASMERHGIGAIIVEPRASLDYYTGVQWW